jgi:hypothetical protein
LEKHTEHLERNDGPSPLAFACVLRIIEPRGFGDRGELATQREWIERTHTLVEIHAHALARSLYADLNVGEDDGVLQRRQVAGEALLQRRWPLCPSLSSEGRNTRKCSCLRGFWRQTPRLVATLSQQMVSLSAGPER